MSILNQAIETQMKNIQTKTGRTLDELAAIIQKSGFSKHSEIRDMFHREMGLGYGDANALTHAILQSDGTRAAQGLSEDHVLDTIYTGSKASMRPIHEKIMAQVLQFGEFEILPKMGYISLRRRKQFAMIGPATNTRFEVGLNIKGLESGHRLIEQLPGGMCTYKVKLTDAAEVDSQLIGWIKQAYDGAA